MEIKYFELKWEWGEEYVPYIFSHINKTAEDFEKDCKNLFKKHAEEYIDHSKSFVGMHRLTELISKKLPALGYILIIPECSFGKFGAFIIDEEDEEIRELVGSETFEKAVNHNKNGYKTIFKTEELKNGK